MEGQEANTETQYATSFLAKEHSVSLVNVENMADLPYEKKDPVIRAVTSEIVSVFKEIASLNPLFRDQIASFSMSQSAGNVFEEPAKLADFAAAVSAGEPLELQEVMETLSIPDRLQKALIVLKKELMNAQLQNKISKEVESKIAKRQREYYLMEQLKGIKKELGLESDGKDKLVEGFKEKASKLAMPETVKKVFDEVCVLLEIYYLFDTVLIMWSSGNQQACSFRASCIRIQCDPKLSRLAHPNPVGTTLKGEL